VAVAGSAVIRGAVKVPAFELFVQMVRDLLEDLGERRGIAKLDAEEALLTHAKPYGPLEPIDVHDAAGDRRQEIVFQIDSERLLCAAVEHIGGIAVALKTVPQLCAASVHVVEVPVEGGVGGNVPRNPARRRVVA